MNQPPTSPAPHGLDLRARFQVAVVALVGVVIGSVVGASGAIYAAHVNANATEDVAQKNFAHNQRQALYSKLLTDLTSFDQALSEFVDSDGNIIDLSDADAKIDVQRDYRPAYLAVRSDKNNIHAFGSKAVYDDLHQLEDLSFPAVVMTSMALIQSLNAPDVAAEVRDIKKHLTHEYPTKQVKDALDQRSAFIQGKLTGDIRKDLGY